MFKFFKKDNQRSFNETQLLLKTDIHSHVLPGIDDGSPDIESSLELLKGMHELGIRKVVATPHIIGDMYRNNAATITAALEKLKEAIPGSGLDIELSAAAEYMLDDYFLSLLKNNTPLLSIHDNIILTEQSYVMPLGNLHEVAFELVTRGYKPIMAHPERYGYYHNNFEIYEDLKEMGFLLQVNLLSLTGYYGSSATKAAKFIFEHGLADLVGTDMHHTNHLHALKENIPLIAHYVNGKGFNEFK